jgi:hypothetical protein
MYKYTLVTTQSRCCRGWLAELGIVISMRHGPLYDLIDWSWRATPGFRLLNEDTKAIVTYLLFNSVLIACVVGVWWLRGLI